MQVDFTIHEIQKKILKVLLFKPSARFRDLNTEGLSTDHFSFHIDQLVLAGLVEKKARGVYLLSVKGKEFANRMDTGTVQFERQAKLSVLFAITRESEKGREYLIYHRLKHPFYGFYGFHSGKIRYGEKLLEAAAREIWEETHLEVDLQLKGIKHKLVYSPEKDLLEDKFFFLVHGTNTRGELIAEQMEGRNLWMTRKEVERIVTLFPDVTETMEMIENDQLEFLETEHLTEGF